MQRGRLMRRRGPQGVNRARMIVEALEDRFCLSQTVTGFDASGVGFRLTLTGPGRVIVDKFVPATVNPDNPPLPTGVNPTPGNPDQTLLNSLTNIDKITLIGTNEHSVLTGTVNSPGHEVLFEQLIQDSSSLSTGAVHLVGFSLARTNTLTSTSTAATSPLFTEKPMISFPNGIGYLDMGNIELNDPAINTQLTTANQTSTATIDLTTVAHQTNVHVQRIDVGPRMLLQINVDAAAGTLNSFHARSVNGHSEVAPPATGMQASSDHVFEGVTQLIVNPVSETELGAQVSTSSFSFGISRYVHVDQDAHNFQVEAASLDHVRIGGSFTGDLIDRPVTTSSLTGAQLQAVNLIGTGTGTPDLPALSTAVIHASAEIRGDVKIRNDVQQARISSRVVGDVAIRGRLIDSMLRSDSFFRSVRVLGDITGSEILAGLVERNAADQSTPGQWVQNGQVRRLRTAGAIMDTVIAASYDPENDVFGDADDDPLSGGRITGRTHSLPQGEGPTAVHGYSIDPGAVGRVFARGGLGAVRRRAAGSGSTGRARTRRPGRA